MALVALTSLSLLGTSQAINIIYSSTNNIYYIVSSLFSVNHTTHIETVYNFLEKTDLQTTLEIYTTLLREIDFSSYDYESFHISLQNIRKIIQSIELEMIDIHNKTIYNHSLYSGTKWLSYTFRSNVQHLEVLHSKLENSIRTLKIVQNIIQNNKKKKQDELEKSYILPDEF